MFIAWTFGSFALYSWAGEKMPWLTMHLTIPLAFVSGWALDQVLEADWRGLIARGASETDKRPLELVIEILRTAGRSTVAPFRERIPDAAAEGKDDD